MSYPGDCLRPVCDGRETRAPCLAQWVRTLPWATLIVWTAVRTIPRTLLDVAAVEGAGPVVTLVAVVLPLRWPAFAAAWLVAVAVSLGDLAASILVVPPGITTLSIRIFGLLHYGVEDDVAGICLALGGLVVALAWPIARWLGRGEIEHGPGDARNMDR